jgi:DNA-binding Lrp family transcriptional regulator
MVVSIILMNVRRNKVKAVAEVLADISEISEVYSVSGRYDLVAIVRVQTNDQLAELVTSRLANLEDIEHTETMLAFKGYSRHDLEAMFSI